MRPIFILPLLALAAGSTLAATSQDEETLQLRETVISGNQELPKVLYILPWRETDRLPLKREAPGYDLEGVMQPIYPQQYRREMKYRALSNSLDQNQEN